MTDLFPTAAADPVDVLIAWLLPLGLPTWPKHPTNSELPYVIVNRISGGADENQFTDDAVVSVHWIGKDYQQARDAARDGDRRIDLLARHLEPLSIPSGLTVAIEYLDTFQKPIHVDYGDTALARFVARYSLGLSYVAV